MIHYKIWKDEDTEIVEDQCEVLALTGIAANEESRAVIMTAFRDETDGIDTLNTYMNVCTMLSVLTRDMMRHMLEIVPVIPEKLLEAMIQKKIEDFERKKEETHDDVISL